MAKRNSRRRTARPSYSRGRSSYKPARRPARRRSGGSRAGAQVVRLVIEQPSTMTMAPPANQNVMPVTPRKPRF